jgi:valyl-tRNA synthetase
MPFITEELTPYFSDQPLSRASFPKVDEPFLNSSQNRAAAQWIQEGVIETVSKIRNIRGEMNIPPSEEMAVIIDTQDPKISEAIPYIKRLAGIGEVRVQSADRSQPSAVVQTAWGQVDILLDSPRVEKEVDRLKKVLQKMEKEQAALSQMLQAADFSKAPIEVQEKNRLRYDTLCQKQREITEQLSRLQRSTR